jgi:hypothetical protein
MPSTSNRSPEQHLILPKFFFFVRLKCFSRLSSQQMLREPGVRWIDSKRPSSYWFAVLVVLVSLLSICVAPEASSERVRQCESYGPRAKRFVLVGAWTGSPGCLHLLY